MASDSFFANCFARRLSFLNVRQNVYIVHRVNEPNENLQLLLTINGFITQLPACIDV